MAVDFGAERDYQAAASGPSPAGGPVVVTIQARPGARVQIGFCHVSYSAAPVGGRLTISDGSGNPLDLDLTLAGTQLFGFPGDGISFNLGQPVVVTLAGGGAAVIAKISLAYRYVYRK